MILTIRTCIVRYVYDSGVETIHLTIRIAEGLYRIVQFVSWIVWYLLHWLALAV